MPPCPTIFTTNKADDDTTTAHCSYPYTQTTLLLLSYTKATPSYKRKAEPSPSNTICISTVLAATELAMPPLDTSLLKRRASLSTPLHSQTSSKTRTEKIDREKALERNIDNVVFGDVMFKSWYPSWYPKEIIGEKALNGDGKGIVVQTLYVCKKCFGYSRVVEEWVGHCRICEKGVPGKRVYVHGAEKDVGEGSWSVWEVDGEVDTVSL